MIPANAVIELMHRKSDDRGMMSHVHTGVTAERSSER